MKNLSGAVEIVARRVLPARSTLGMALKIAGHRGRDLALLYHRVGAAENGSHRVVPILPFDVFRRHLEILGNAGEIVPLRKLLEPSERDRPVRFAVTFDDDDPGYVEFVLPVLQSLGVQATFFLSGRRLHNLGAYRWELIERAIARDGMKRVGELLGLPDANPGEMAAACESSARFDRLKEVLPAEADAHPMTQEHIRLLAEAGMEIGFHTVDHLLLPEQAPEELDRALVEGRADLEAAAGKPVSLFAYPFGKADRRVAEGVRAAGYDAAFTNRSHTIGRASHRFLLGRWDTRLRDGDEFVSALALRLMRPGTGPKAGVP